MATGNWQEAGLRSLPDEAWRPPVAETMTFVAQTPILYPGEAPDERFDAQLVRELREIAQQSGCRIVGEIEFDRSMPLERRGDCLRVSARATGVVVDPAAAILARTGSRRE